MMSLTEKQTVTVNATIELLNSFVSKEFNRFNNEVVINKGVTTRFDFDYNVINFKVFAWDSEDQIEMTYDIATHKWTITTYELCYSIANVCNRIFNDFLVEFTVYKTLLDIITSDKLSTILTDGLS